MHWKRNSLKYNVHGYRSCVVLYMQLTHIIQPCPKLLLLQQEWQVACSSSNIEELNTYLHHSTCQWSGPLMLGMNKLNGHSHPAELEHSSRQVWRLEQHINTLTVQSNNHTSKSLKPRIPVYMSGKIEASLYPNAFVYDLTYTCIAQFEAMNKTENWRQLSDTHTIQ